MFYFCDAILSIAILEQIFGDVMREIIHDLRNHLFALQMRLFGKLSSDDSNYVSKRLAAMSDLLVLLEHQEPSAAAQKGSER